MRYGRQTEWVDAAKRSCQARDACALQYSVRCIRPTDGEVPLAQHHDMVEALASYRSDQPFNMTILSR
jgi:hypothetical protein